MDFLGAVLIWWMKYYIMNIVGNLDVSLPSVSFYTAAGLARGISRGYYSGNHHPWLPRCTPHGACERTQEIYLVLWFHPLLHNTWRRPPQPTHPASDTRRQWVANKPLRHKTKHFRVEHRESLHLEFLHHFPTFIFLPLWIGFIGPGRCEPTVMTLGQKI